jgi:hypothetical protein
MKKFLSDNGGMLTVLGIAVVILGAYGEWRISVAVQAEFAAEEQVAPHEIDAIEEDIDDLEVADTRMDSKIERIVDILLEE